MTGKAGNIVLMAHYFAPLSSVGARRFEALARHFAAEGRKVTVITTAKTPADGMLEAQSFDGVQVIELDYRGKAVPSPVAEHSVQSEQGRKSRTAGALKKAVMGVFGQTIDPRLSLPLGLARAEPNSAAAKAIAEADIIVATTPPYPPLLAARLAKRRYGTPIVLDYRDQLSACYEMPGGRIARKLELWLDRYLLSGADHVVTISEPMAAYYRKFSDAVSVVLNGYDPARMEEARKRSPWSGGSVRIIKYLGLVTPGRVPRNFLIGLSAALASGEMDSGALRVEYYGDPGPLPQVIGSEFPELESMIRFNAPVGYDAALEKIVSADCLLFCEGAVVPKSGDEASAAGVIPTKVFEYLASGRPIIADLDPDSLAADFISKGAAEHVVSRSPDAFRDFLVRLASKPIPTASPNAFVVSLTRESQSSKYLDLLDSLIK